jgi:uncharacterized membrane protein
MVAYARTGFARYRMNAMSAGNRPNRQPEPPNELRPATLRAAAILLMTAGCVIFVATGWASPVRVVFSLLFLLFGPGLALAELLEIRDLARRFAIATPASLALETLLAVTLVYAGAFSIRLAITILAAFTVGIGGVALLRARRSHVASGDQHRSAA